jgi:hypothetical protein
MARRWRPEDYPCRVLSLDLAQPPLHTALPIWRHVEDAVMSMLAWRIKGLSLQPPLPACSVVVKWIKKAFCESTTKNIVQNCTAIIFTQTRPHLMENSQLYWSFVAIFSIQVALYRFFRKQVNFELQRSKCSSLRIFHPTIFNLEISWCNFAIDYLYFIHKKTFFRQQN